MAGEQPPNNVWMAARYCVPGLIAHESARQGGVLLEVPDFGPGPGPALVAQDRARAISRA